MHRFDMRVADAYGHSTFDLETAVGPSGATDSPSLVGSGYVAEPRMTYARVTGSTYSEQRVVVVGQPSQQMQMQMQAALQPAASGSVQRYCNPGCNCSDCVDGVATCVESAGTWLVQKTNSCACCGMVAVLCCTACHECASCSWSCTVCRVCAGCCRRHYY